MMNSEDKKLPQEVFGATVVEYEHSLFLPEQKLRHQFFLCPIGLIGAGKTTVLKPLAERLSLVRISGDEIRKILHDKGLNYDQVWEMGAALVKKFAYQGYSVANDTDGATPKTREALEKLSLELGSKLLYIHINPPEDFILNKLKNFKHTWLYRDSDQALKNYYDRKPLHQNLNLPYFFTFDTSADNLEEQINRAEKLIRLETGNL
ncbi:MAG: AAA family ATPase [Candidatus Vogelbacteria bacterium]